MSNLSSASFDFDFWEFVACGRCQLPYSTPNGPPIPFWLTECGHVVCNNHLNADQSCSQCGAQQIELVPLQQEMDLPMSQWFQSVPVWLDHVAFTAKFQLQSMGNQIRFYKSRHQQQRVLIERLKREIAELKMMQSGPPAFVDLASSGHGYPQQQMSYQTQRAHADFTNHNGKRPFVEDDLRTPFQRRPQTRSSPIAPPAPERITLEQNQSPPVLVPEQPEDPPQLLQHKNTGRAVNSRPGTGLAAQYAYNPPSTSQFHPQPLTHAQAAPQAFKRAKPSQSQQVPSNRGQAMGPPPTPHRMRQGQRVVSMGRMATQPPTNAGRLQVMGPPPTPLGNRFKPASQMSTGATSLQLPMSSIGTPRRFVPPSMKENTGGDGGGNRMRFQAPGANSQR